MTKDRNRMPDRFVQMAKNEIKNDPTFINTMTSEEK